MVAIRNIWLKVKSVVLSSHLLGFALFEELCHRGIQLPELAKHGADVFVKVFVLLILVIENCSVLFPFLSGADLWIFSIGRILGKINYLILCVCVCVRWSQVHHIVCITHKDRGWFFSLTWCSLRWCVLWECIQYLCSHWLGSYGNHTDWCYLYSETYPLHPWMICALFFEELVGWTGETLPGAESKRQEMWTYRQKWSNK